MSAPAASSAAAPARIRKRPAEDGGGGGDGAATDRDALAALYRALGGDGWTRRHGWLTDAPLAEWYGVRVRDGRVRVLELSRNGLRGTLADPALAPGLKRLGDALEQLWLSENALTGTLPSVLADGFPKLTILDVGSNTLRGALPPAFAVRAFSWFDTSGNQLTSYARLADAANDSAAAAAATPSALPPCTAVALPAAPPATPFAALWQAHVSPSLLSADEGAALVALAEQWAAEHAGWETSRHRAYKTTDVDVAVCGGGLLALCNAHLERRILPLMAARFGFPAADLAVEDLFVAKYSAAAGKQRALGEHRDGSELSFVITLNSPQDFGGGGTRFVGGTTAGDDDDDDDVVVAPVTAGTGCFFCGRHLHSGVAVTSGTRYILAGFVRVFATSEAATARLAHLKSIDKDSRNQQGKRSTTQFGKKRRR